jgi:hypothetical protein
MLSHLAVKQIELPSILAYISILCKISEERGTSFAMRYHYYLHNNILDRIRTSERFELDSCLAVEQGLIIRKIESRPVNPLRTGRNEAEKTDRRIPPRAFTGQHINKFKRKLVCLKHRPHENARCSNPECLKTKEHLDTTIPELLSRFQKASSAAEAKKPRSSNQPSNQKR